jgi:hypothetical protein
MQPYNAVKMEPYIKPTVGSRIDETNNRLIISIDIIHFEYWKDSNVSNDHTDHGIGRGILDRTNWYHNFGYCRIDAMTLKRNSNCVPIKQGVLDRIIGDMYPDIGRNTFFVSIVIIPTMT